MATATLATPTPKLITPLPRPTTLNIQQNKTAVNTDSIEAMTPETDKKVKGTFVNIECPGQPAKICGLYYKGMSYFEKTFEDGEKCTIPLSVARFINERCNYDQHSYILDDRGTPIKSQKAVPRYKFTSEF
jgi:hypothetical protein